MSNDTEPNNLFRNSTCISTAGTMFQIWFLGSSSCPSKCSCSQDGAFFRPRWLWMELAALNVVDKPWGCSNLCTPFIQTVQSFYTNGTQRALLGLCIKLVFNCQLVCGMCFQDFWQFGSNYLSHITLKAQASSCSLPEVFYCLQKLLIGIQWFL